MKRQNCINCIFSSWYENFKRVTFRSKVIRLPVEFIDYLKSDGIVLPDADTPSYSNELEGYSSDEERDWNDQDRSSVCPDFSELKREVKQAIEELGGEVFLKLNWSSPKDASWITHNGTLKCTNFNEVCLLLKSSDFVTNDLTNAYKFCIDNQTPHSSDSFELVLRKWVNNWVPGTEFRCFIKENKIIGISQRHINTYFDYLVNNKDRILSGINNFFKRKIKNLFADSCYTFDIYIDSQNHFSLVDFNPFGEITDPMLFTWEELNDIDPETIDTSSDTFFRIVTESNNIQPSPYMKYGMPTDIVDLACGEDIQKMIDFLNVKDLIVKPE